MALASWVQGPSGVVYLECVLDCLEEPPADDFCAEAAGSCEGFADADGAPVGGGSVRAFFKGRVGEGRGEGCLHPAKEANERQLTSLSVSAPIFHISGWDGDEIQHS